jgi:hypothetical protein
MKSQSANRKLAGRQRLVILRPRGLRGQPSDWTTLDPYVHALLAERTPEQALLLDVIYAGRKLAGWRNFKHAGSYGIEKVGKPSRWPTSSLTEDSHTRIPPVLVRAS